MTVIARENILSTGRRVTGCMGRVGNGEAFEINGIRVAGRSPESIVSPSPRRPAVAVLGRVGRREDEEGAARAKFWEPKMMISVPFSRPDGLICLSRPSQPRAGEGARQLVPPN